MSRISYVNGKYLQHRDAFVHVDDRGYQFADGVYEVLPVFGGRIVNRDKHFERLAGSLGELRIAWPVTPRVLNAILLQILQRNQITDGGMIYLQITRGVAPRAHAFPLGELKPSLVITARRVDMTARAAQAAIGVRIISVHDNRWARRDIKSVSLLPNILAKQKATEAGGYEALFVTEDGVVTECASSTFWIVNSEGVLLTHPLGHDILPGVTRRTLLKIVQETGVKFEERKFTLNDALAAREAFLTSATTFVMPVTQIDSQTIGNGIPGPVSLMLRAAYIDKIK